MNNTPEYVTVRVRDLHISPKNTRKRPSKTIRERAASIRHHGLLKPLIIEHVPGKGKKPGHYEVIDGGTRLRALELLIQENFLDSEHRIVCSLYTGNAATEISVAANMHEGMHPADEFEAFREMIDAGATIEEVAARFGTTPLTVQRRLKLANVAPSLIQAYRDDEGINLDHLMALAISDDHKTQEKLWNKVRNNQWDRAPERLRRALVRADSINAAQDKRARFVGLDAYESAGGPVVRDLFSNGGGFIGDEGLLQRLAEEKLEAAAADVRAEGWSWVKTVDQWTYSDEMAYSKSQGKKRDLTDEEAELLAGLREREEALDKQVHALDIEDEELVAELDDVRGQIESIEALRLEYTDRQKAKGGTVLTIDHGGQLKIVRGLIVPAERKAKQPTESTAGGGTGEEAPAADEAERPLSERLVTQLTAHRTAALQALVAQSPAVALAALLLALVPQVFMSPEDRYRYSAAAKVSLTNNRGCGRQAADDLDGSRAWVSLEESIGRWQERLPGEDEDLFIWLQNLSQADQVDLLAVCVAHSVNTVEQREDSAGHAVAHQLAAAVGLDMADWWEPTAGSYLANVPKSRRMAAVREAVDEQAAEQIAGMKKEAMIGAAEEYLAGRRWLPQILRQPGSHAAPTETTTPAAGDATETAEVGTPVAGPNVRLARVRYRDENGNTWTGRGKRPAWVEQALQAGKSLDELLVQPANTIAEEA
ncbi:H-NS family nucleoid-associated regulatory protein [Cupriavidus plantarum]|uniref:H-NS family nucleoid-associated regulatory protein n=1 Tax=Cupriavidus plantarum TaxID=942865 RepID=UPI000EB1AA3C|nr:ParB N-terminal domain-containing protein [Cupriavidus plantarum]RLK45972.1 ParB family chromosome partitioning protein [Cupriavidus plantarum]